MSDFVARNLLSLAAIRKSFIESENSERIRRALRHNIRERNTFEVGEPVYYLGRGKPGWHGPAKIIGRDGKLVVLRNGSYVNRVHETDLKLSPLDDWLKCDCIDETTESAVCNEKIDSGVENSETLPAEEVDDVSWDLREVESAVDDAVTSENCANEVVSSHEVIKPIHGPVHSKKALLPKFGQTIRLSNSHADICDKTFMGEVLSRAGKANGKNKGFFNVKWSHPDDVAGQSRCIDLLSEENDWNIVSEPEVSAFLSSTDDFVVAN